MLNLQETHGEQSLMHSEDRCPMCATVLQVIWVHAIASARNAELTSTLAALARHWNRLSSFKMWASLGITNYKGELICSKNSKKDLEKERLLIWITVS